MVGVPDDSQIGAQTRIVCTMTADHTIGVLVWQTTDRRLIESFLKDSGHHSIVADRYDRVDFTSRQWEDMGLLIVDEVNVQEFGDEILGLKLRDMAGYLPILALVSNQTPVSTWLKKGFDDVLRVPITHSEFDARVQAFLRLRAASEQRFQTLFDNTPIGIFRVAPSGRLLLANPALISMLGFADVDELRQATRKDSSIVPASALKNYIGEAVWKSRAGAGVPVLVRSMVVRDLDGQVQYVEGTVEDLTERKEIESALRDHAARLTLALDAASMGDIDLHFDSATVDCGHMVYRLFGYETEPPDERILHLASRVHPDDLTPLRLAVDKAIEDGSTLDQEFRVVWPGGDERWLRARGEVMYRDDTTPERLIGVIRDATDEKRLQLDLIQAKIEAEQMAALKSTFLANMSHEIRTPLTAIIGFASLLSSRVAADQRGAVRRIQEGGQRLLETLNAVLTLARLEARQMDLVMENVDIVKETRGTMEMFEHQAREKGLELLFDAPSRPLRAQLDRGAFASIVQNLISNAIKFTEKGTVTVAVAVDATHADGKRAVVSVTDTGAGIEEKFIPLLFDEFQQESSGIRRLHEGAGLGLAIVKRLSDLLGGEVSVTSQKNVGSTFRVYFPISAQKRGKALRSAVVPDDEATDEAAPKLLIVEDNEDTRRLLTELLSDRFSVEVASDAPEALSLAKDRSFDVVLMDINLGDGLTGVDVAGQLREQPRFKHTPIVALTAYALPGDRERFLLSGFTAHLPKPFNPDALVELIRELK